jgi:hypothetical protein
MRASPTAFLWTLFVALAARSTHCQPFNNGSIAFCRGREDGQYCMPSDALHIVSCPSGERVPCPLNRFCASVGRVPDCYECEAPVDGVTFCEGRGAGTYCGPRRGGALGVWRCPEGTEIACPYGTHCKSLHPHEEGCHEAVCAPRRPRVLLEEKMGGGRCRRHTHTTSSLCGCTSVSSSRLATTTLANTYLTSISSSFSVCGGRSTFTAITSVAVPLTTITLVLDFTETLTYSNTVTFPSFVTTVSTITESSATTFAQTPNFICLNAQTLTNVDNTSDVQVVCLSGILDVACAVSTTNNISQSFCESLILPIPTP